jgi:mannose-1-phosphate guanylyltransferase
MKAFLLAAGHGTRLRPLTDSLPKCLVPIRGVPLLQIWLDLCRRNGIDQLLINVHAHSEAVCKFVREFSREDLEIVVFEEKVLLGSAGTLLANRRWLDTDPAFWVFYADVLTTANLATLREVHERNDDHLATLGVYEVPDPQRCGIVTLDKEGIVREFVEKPKNPSGGLAFSGLMIARREILDLIADEGLTDIGFHVLPKLIGRMSAVPITDYLLDIGTMENYRHAQETWPGA